MKVFIHLPDEVKDCVALAVSEGMVESPDQLVTCVDDRVDVELRGCRANRENDVVVIWFSTNVVDGGCVELHVEVLLSRGKSVPGRHY